MHLLYQLPGCYEIHMLYLMWEKYILFKVEWRLANTIQTCCNVNLLAILSLPAWILWVDKANISSSKLHFISLAAFVKAAKRKRWMELLHCTCLFMPSVLSIEHVYEMKQATVFLVYRFLLQLKIQFKGVFGKKKLDALLFDNKIWMFLCIVVKDWSRLASHPSFIRPKNHHKQNSFRLIFSFLSSQHCQPNTLSTTYISTSQ